MKNIGVIVGKIPNTIISQLCDFVRLFNIRASVSYNENQRE